MPRHLPRPARHLALLLFPLVAGVACRHDDPHDTGPRARALETSPTLTVQQPSHDFGNVLEGERLEHVFVLENTGAGRLFIEEVRSTCGCTAAVVAEKEVPPGGTTRIEVKFDTRGRRGKNQKTITVTSNDPQSPSLRLDITAQVESLLALSPGHLQLTAQHGETVTQESWLEGRRAADARLVVKGGTIPGLTASVIRRTVDEKTEQGVRLTLAARRIGNEAGTVQLATGVSERPDLELRFGTAVRGNLTVPARLYLDPSRPNLRERTLTVTSTRQDLQLTSVRVVEGPFTAKLLGPNAAGTPEVLVTAEPPPGQQRALTGSLVVRSNDPLEPEKSIQLTLAGPRSHRAGAAVSATPSRGR